MRYCSCLSDTHPCPGSEVTQKPCPSNGRVFPFRLSHDRHNRQEGRAGLPVLSLDQGHVDRVWSVCATDRVFERASEGMQNLNPAPKRQGSFIAAYNRSKRSTDVGRRTPVLYAERCRRYEQWPPLILAGHYYIGWATVSATAAPRRPSGKAAPSVVS